MSDEIAEGVVNVPMTHFMAGDTLFMTLRLGVLDLEVTLPFAGASVIGKPVTYVWRTEQGKQRKVFRALEVIPDLPSRKRGKGRHRRRK